MVSYDNFTGSYEFSLFKISSFYLYSSTIFLGIFATRF